MLTGYWYKEKPILLKGAEILATFQDGTPALTHSQNGKGQAFLFGALMGFKYNNAEKDQSLAQLIGNISREVGIVQPVKVSNSGGGIVKAKVLKNGKDYLIFCLNYGADCSADFNIKLPIPLTIKNLITGQKMEYSIVDNNTKLELQMASKEASILVYSIE